MLAQNERRGGERTALPKHTCIPQCKIAFSVGDPETSTSLAPCRRKISEE